MSMGSFRWASYAASRGEGTVCWDEKLELQLHSRQIGQDGEERATSVQGGEKESQVSTGVMPDKQGALWDSVKDSPEEKRRKML